MSQYHQILFMLITGSMYRALKTKLLMLLIAFLGIFHGSLSMAATNSWTRAEAAIHKFMEQRIAEVKLYLGNESPESVEVRDPLLKQYLPDIRLFILDTGLVSVSRIFFVDEQANISDLGHGHWQGVDERGT